MNPAVFCELGKDDDVLYRMNHPTLTECAAAPAAPLPESGPRLGGAAAL